MEIPARSFIPVTKRNRWAWGFAWASLAVFLLWNLMPYYDYDYPERAWIKKGLVMMQVWPNIINSLSHTLRSTPNFGNMLGIVMCLGLIFLGTIQFLLVPLWRIISMSRLFRWIPAIICLLGLLPVLYVICVELRYPEDRSFALLMPSLIALNFLLSALALLLYHPEPEPEPIPAS